MRQALGALRPAPTRGATLLAEPLEPRILMSANPLVPHVDGRIDVPGEVGHHAFRLKTDVRVAMDSLTPSNQGSGAGQQGDWTDSVSLSANATLGDNDDVPIGSVAHGGGLAKGDQ